MRSLVAVSSHVLLQVSRINSPVITPSASKRLLTRMLPHVHSKVSTLTSLIVTLRTRVELLLLMNGPNMSV